MSIAYPLKSATLLYRRPDYDQDFVGFMEGDIYEFTDQPIYEVDSKTRAVKDVLQCFEVGADGRTLRPVTRAWLKIQNNERQRTLRKVK